MSAKRTILLADDAAMFRELGSIFLERTGNVVTASDGHESLVALREHHPSIVVADLDMPRMAGDELCRRIKDDPATRELPVILVTGTDLADDRARALRAGADDIVTKPISRISLVATVNRFLNGRPERGLARVPFESDVRILQADAVHRGIAQNLSRGGIFVETAPTVGMETEVALEFSLPDRAQPVSPSAQVIWRRSPGGHRASGVGLQFLALDRASSDRIEAYVYEHTSHTDGPLIAGAGEL